MEWRSGAFFSEKHLTEEICFVSQFGNLYLAVMCQVTYSVFIRKS